MFKRVSLSLIFAGLLVGIVPAAQAASLLDNLSEKISNSASRTADRLNTKFGTLDKDKKKFSRSAPREMVEQLLLAFYFGGRNADGTFDTIKGATAARDGLFKVASDSLLNDAMFEFLKERLMKKYDEEGLARQMYKDYYRIWSRLGFDFFLRGIQYANGTAKDKSFSAFLKDEYLPNFAKKLAVYWSLFGLRMGTASVLSRSPLGNNIMKLYTASHLIPFVGIVIEDAAEHTLEDIYDKGLDKAKQLTSKLMHKFAKQQQPAVA